MLNYVQSPGIEIIACATAWMTGLVARDVELKGEFRNLSYVANSCVKIKLHKILFLFALD